ncbi:universal stress protein [Pontibacter qinzhouensis]|nr:universal stress protein [Pontibacter qinzhouensis]
MKTILVPIDFSPDSKNALLYALELAQKPHIRIIVFHAFYPAALPPAAYETPSFIQNLERVKCRELEQYVNVCKEAAPHDYVFDFRCAPKVTKPENLVPGYTEQVFHTIVAVQEPQERFADQVTCVARMGTVYEQILSVAEAYEADLIVMGMQGGSALEQALIGSTTLSIMRNCSVPVLGVPLHARFRGLRSVVFASDLSRQPDKTLLRLLRGFMKTFKPRLELLHLHRQQDMQAEYRNVERTLEAFDEQLHDIDYKVVLRQRPEVVAGIREYLQERQPSALILSPQKHTFIKRLFNKSVTAQMVAYHDVPLLTLPSSRTNWQEREPEELEKVHEH